MKGLSFLKRGISRRNAQAFRLSNLASSQTILVPQNVQPNMKQSRFKFSEATIHYILCAVAILVVPIVLAIWLPLRGKGFDGDAVFEGAPIGGKLSLNQAKAIDFASSAIFAPLILAGFNYIWFSNARVAIGDERRQPGTALHAFVEASHTASGSYDLLKFWTLVTSRSGKLAILAVLCIFAAISSSTLSNIIAYEAITVAAGESRDVRLQLLADSRLDNFTPNPNIAGSGDPIVFFNVTISGDVSEEFGNAFWWAMFGNTTTNLTDHEYILPRIPAEQLINFNKTVQLLDDVPALRASIDCDAYTPSSIQIVVSAANNPVCLLVDTIIESGDVQNWTGPGFLAEFPAIHEDITEKPDNDYLSYLAYSADSTEFFWGVLGGSASKGASSETPYGTIVSKEYPMNLTLSGGGGPTDIPYSAWTWGMKCSIRQRNGSMTLSRPSGNDTWQQENQIWQDGGDTISAWLAAYSLYSDQQRDIPSNWTSIGAIMGVSAATCNYTSDAYAGTDFCDGIQPTDVFDWQAVADNLLWTIMDTRRLIYEGAVESATSSATSSFITVQAKGDAQRYRMTYVPALLAVGLGCLLVAAALTSGMMIFSMKSRSSRKFRKVDSLRLMIDALASFREEELFKMAREWSNTELEDWAKKYLVRYEVEFDEASHDGTIVLKPVRTTTSKEKLQSTASTTTMSPPSMATAPPQISQALSMMNISRPNSPAGSTRSSVSSVSSNHAALPQHN